MKNTSRLRGDTYTDKLIRDIERLTNGLDVAVSRDNDTGGVILFLGSDNARVERPLDIDPKEWVKMNNRQKKEQIRAWTKRD